MAEDPGYPARGQVIRDASPADLPGVLALNAAFEHYLSPLTPERLRQLHAMSAYHRVCVSGAGLEGFLLAMREGASYDSPNFLWFAARYPRFLYVDRIVVAAPAQGRCVGRALYEDLFRAAQASGLEMVACEYDIDPPNPSSARFHARMGFSEIGRQQLPSGKWVSLQAARLPSGA